MAVRVPFGERYLAGRSAIHTADARVKLPATLAYIFAVTLTPVAHWPALALLALPLVAVLALSSLSPLVVLRRSALALPFILAAVPLMFTKEGETLFSVPPFGWTASQEGLEAVLSILAKSWLSVVAAVILTATTPAAELLRAARAWRAKVLGNMVGSLFLRTYERSERVYAAMQARGYDGEPRFLWAPAWRLIDVALAVALVVYLSGVEVYARY
jgi:cobalt/nickel transport system permease protein